MLKTIAADENRAGPFAREGAERMWGILRSVPRSRSYPALGAVLALGTPAGLLLANALPLTQSTPRLETWTHVGARGAHR